METEKIILGLSIGTTHMGIALYSHREFVDWRLRTFEGKWSEEKLRKIVGVIEKLLLRYGIRHLAVKVPLLSKTDAMERLTLEVRTLAEKHQVRLSEYTLEELEFFFAPGQRLTKRQMIEALVKKYPDLLLDYNRAGRGIQDPWERIYEAVAAVELYRHEHSKNWA